MGRLLGTLMAAACMVAQDLPGPRSSPPRVPEPNLPMPRLPRIPLPGKRKPPPKQAEAPPVMQYVGVLRAITAGSLDLERLDGKLVAFVCDPETEYFSGPDAIPATDLVLGEDVRIEARGSEDKLIALKVVRRSKPEPVAQSETESDPDRPILRRGKPKQEDNADRPATSAEEAFWKRAMDEAREYGEFLPNFICREQVTRFYSTSRKPSFRRLDTLTVDVAYVGGKEYYSNHRIGTRRASEVEAEATGSWSFGEYGSTVREVLRGAAKFRFMKDSKASGLDAKLYQVEVAQQDSGWKVQYKGRVVKPAYKGSVWVDVNTGRVLRIELQSLKIPQDFEIERAEWVVDFAYVELGGDYYLLPVAASNLACWRYKSDCSKNEIEFQNYKQFGSDSFLYTTESNVEFEKPPNRKAGNSKRQ